MRRVGDRNASSKSRTSSTLKYEVSEVGAVKVVWPEGVAGESGAGFDLAATDECVIPLSSYSCDASRPCQISIQPLPPAYIGGYGQMQLEADRGEMVAYEDHLRHPEEPTAPIKLAVEALNPGFDFHNVDGVMDENVLKKLFGFLRLNCSATSMIVPGGLRDPPFKLQVDAFGVDDPMIFTRVEQYDCIPTPPNVFGQAFEAALTRPVTVDSNAMFYSIVHFSSGNRGLWCGARWTHVSIPLKVTPGQKGNMWK